MQWIFQSPLYNKRGTMSNLFWGALGNTPGYSLTTATRHFSYWGKDTDRQTYKIGSRRSQLLIIRHFYFLHCKTSVKIFHLMLRRCDLKFLLLGYSPVSCYKIYQHFIWSSLQNSTETNGSRSLNNNAIKVILCSPKGRQRRSKT